MTIRSQQTGMRRWLPFFLAAMIAALAAIIFGTTASAPAAGVAETRVRVIDVAGEVHVEPAQHVSPGQHPHLGLDPRQIVVATGVAANGGDTLLSAGGGSARLPMNMGTVRGVASKYGIPIDDLSITINKARAGVRGFTGSNGCITLCRGAFESEEQLAKTLVHERVHVEDLRAGMPYPSTYDAKSAAEVRAEAIANAWWASFG